MSALTKRQRFDLLTAAMAMAEERDGVPISVAARELGVDEPVLLDVLESVLGLEFRLRDPIALAAGADDPVDRVRDPVDFTYAFEITERGVFQVRAEHWLRDIAAEPPEPDAALRLLLAASAMRAADEITPTHLGGAITKLRHVLAAEIVVTVNTPGALTVVRDAIGRARTLEFRYVKVGNTAPTARTVVPHRVFFRWGAWYLLATPVGTEDVRTFRVDGMVDPSVGADEATPQPVEIPAEWDLAAAMQVVDVTVDAADLALLRGAFGVESAAPLGDDRVRVAVTVRGAEQLENLMLRVRPGSEFHDRDLAARRVELAQRLLSR